MFYRVDVIVEYVKFLVDKIVRSEGVLMDRRIGYRPMEIGSRQLDCCFRVMLARRVEANSTNYTSGSTEGVR